MSKRSKQNRPKDCPFVGKGGLKLQFALEQFALDVHGLITADLGCNVGGFTDALLQNGAAKVYAVDTSYGLLAWKLRTDERVVVFERTNALHWESPEPLDLAVGDMGWTKQERVLPVMARILKQEGLALSLVKPQYESPKEWLVQNVLPQERIPEVLEMVHAVIPAEMELLGEARSPYEGAGGNTEYWMLLKKHG